MHKLKVYLDTSIINFLSADDAPDYQDITLEFLNNYFNDYLIHISDIVLFEINKTKNVIRKNELLSLIKKYKLMVFNSLNEEIENLARLYIDKNIIPESKFEDALHLAFATFYEFDILLSWNFKHLANIKKEIEINSINALNGFEKRLNLTNPMELIYEK